MDSNFSSTDRDELDRIENCMRQLADTLRDSESLQDRPGRWIQTIAANFFPGKFFSFKNERSQTGERAKCRARRSSRTGADNRDIEDFHFSFSVGDKQTERSEVSEGFLLENAKRSSFLDSLLSHSSVTNGLDSAGARSNTRAD